MSTLKSNQISKYVLIYGDHDMCKTVSLKLQRKSMIKIYRIGRQKLQSINVKFQDTMTWKRNDVTNSQIVGSRVLNTLPIVDCIYADTMYSSLQE